VSRPLDRTCHLPELGEVNREAGEFWVSNPFLMPQFGHNLSAYERNRLFLNVAGEGFVDASGFSSVDLDSDSRSAVTADFDRDGRVDLLVGSVGGGPLRLFLNRLPRADRHSVKLKLATTGSNRSAIGTRCELRCGDLRVVRDVFAANGCMGQGPPELVYGVGASPSIDSLTVRWPDGDVQTYTDLPVDATIRITEGSADAEVEPFSKTILNAATDRTGAQAR
jgi:hypothetical protein